MELDKAFGYMELGKAFGYVELDKAFGYMELGQLSDWLPMALPAACYCSPINDQKVTQRVKETLLNNICIKGHLAPRVGDMFIFD